MSKSKKETSIDPQFKVKKKITGIPFIKIESGDAVYIRFDSNMYSGLMKKKPAVFANVTNLKTGEICKLLLNRVLEKTIHENYPNDSFVAKSFCIIKGEKVKGGENDYYEFELSEIE